MISDESVRELYQECLDALAKSGLGQGVKFQICRGVTQNGWKMGPRGNKPIGNICNARMVAFNTYNIIPEYCFGCYKVVIEPRNVVELFKLMALIDEIELPNDNTRKCIVEVRPNIEGYYKGFVYCQSLSDGRELEERMKQEVAREISEGVPISLKRGCSEYRVAHPEYAAFDANGQSVMSYNEAWRPLEDHTFENLIGHLKPSDVQTYSTGYTFQDIQVMNTWLAYAAAIGDVSYLAISGAEVRPLEGLKKPPFRKITGINEESGAAES